MARRPQDAWWTEPDTVSNSNRPKTGSSWPRVLWKIYVWAGVILLPLLVLSNVALASQALDGTDDAPISVDSTRADVDSASAQLAIESWIAQDPTPVPGGRILGLSSVVKSDPADSDTGETPNYKIATYEFLISDKDRNLYKAAIQMTLSKATGAVPVSDPALIPLPAADPNSVSDVWPWPGVEQGSSNDDVEIAASAWSSAFASGDPGLLKQAVGDPDTNHAYQPLSGVKVTDTSVDMVGNLWGEDQNREEEDRPEQMVARVILSVQWAGEEKGNSDAQLTFDVLVDRANTGAPGVVAWGAPGQQLTPYGNAIEGRDLDKSKTGDDEESPDATPDSEETPR